MPPPRLLPALAAAALAATALRAAVAQPTLAVAFSGTVGPRSGDMAASDALSMDARNSPGSVQAPPPGSVEAFSEECEGDQYDGCTITHFSNVCGPPTANTGVVCLNEHSLSGAHAFARWFPPSGAADRVTALRIGVDIAERVREGAPGLTLQAFLFRADSEDDIIGHTLIPAIFPDEPSPADMDPPDQPPPWLGHGETTVLGSLGGEWVEIPLYAPATIPIGAGVAAVITVSTDEVPAPSVDAQGGDATDLGWSFFPGGVAGAHVEGDTYAAFGCIEGGFQTYTELNFAPPAHYTMIEMVRCNLASCDLSVAESPFAPCCQHGNAADCEGHELPEGEDRSCMWSMFNVPYRCIAPDLPPPPPSPPPPSPPPPPAPPGMACTCHSCSVCPMEALSCTERGDLDNDGLVNVVDVVSLINLVLEQGR